MKVKAGGMVQVTEPSKCKALSSNPSTTKNKNMKTKRKEN
jgi:hypothetical protein